VFQNLIMNRRKTTTDLNAKHFSRYGEFLASFELSKHGWDTYTPIYDEYIDIMIHKIICKKCGQAWNTNPKLICNHCKKEITSSNKSKIIAYGKCLKCGHNFHKKNQRKCPKCKSNVLESIPNCPFCKTGTVTIEDTDCKKCGHREHIEKFRTIQVKASRIETRGNSYAVDLKSRDLMQGNNHFYIWVCIDEDERPQFIVIPIRKFEEEAKSFISSTSFLKDQGREHFSAKSFGKWKKFLNKFEVLE